MKASGDARKFLMLEYDCREEANVCAEEATRRLGTPPPTPRARHV